MGKRVHFGNDILTIDALNGFQRSDVDFWRYKRMLQMLRITKSKINSTIAAKSTIISLARDPIMQLSFKLPLLLLLFRFSQALPQTLPQAAAVAGDTIDDQNDIVADPTADVVPDEPDTFIIPVPPANDSQLFLNRNDGSVPDKATDKRDFDSYKSWVDVKQEPHPGTLPDSMTYPISVTRTNLLAFYKAAMAYSARQPQQDSVTNMGWLNFTQNGLSLTMTPRGTALQGAHKFSWADYNQMAWRLSEIVRHYTDENTKTW